MQVEFNALFKLLTINSKFLYYRQTSRLKLIEYDILKRAL